MFIARQFVKKREKSVLFALKLWIMAIKTLFRILSDRIGSVLNFSDFKLKYATSCFSRPISFYKSIIKLPPIWSIQTIEKSPKQVDRIWRLFFSSLFCSRQFILFSIMQRRYLNAKQKWEMYKIVLEISDIYLESLIWNRLVSFGFEPAKWWIKDEWMNEWMEIAINLFRPHIPTNSQLLYLN